MKKVKTGIIIIFFSILSSCCDCPDITALPWQTIASKDMAEVDRVNGLYVFIKSEPLKEYDYLGTYTTKWFMEVEKFTNLKGKNLLEIMDEVTETIDFNEKIEKTVDEVKKEYPKADAVVFDTKMSSCKIIRFKK
ncbi:MAG: hypothetical protein JXB49_20860 [Bacteroidales bacterium]|nr:hypothetical protein [Bacteroidales bacterium]